MKQHTSHFYLLFLFHIGIFFSIFIISGSVIAENISDSVQCTVHLAHERNLLIQEDAVKPLPHCVMGYRILSSFAAFRNITQISRHHHIKYYDSLNFTDNAVLFQSHIINFADRVDIFINQDMEFPHVRRVFDCVGPSDGSRIAPPSVWPSASLNSVGVPDN